MKYRESKREETQKDVYRNVEAKRVGRRNHSPFKPVANTLPILICVPSGLGSVNRLSRFLCGTAFKDGQCGHPTD